MKELKVLEEKYKITGTVGDQVSCVIDIRREMLGENISGLAHPPGLGDGGALLPPALRVQQTD